MRFKDRDKGKQRRQKAYTHLIQEAGLAPHQAAAVVGNLMQESHAHLDSTVENHIGAFGIAQWLGDRKAALIDYADRKGVEATDFDTQLEFLTNELNTTGNSWLSKKDKEAFFNAKTVEEAAWLFQRKFERAGETMEDEAMQRRIKNAKGIYLAHNDTAIYSKDDKGQIVNLNPEVATKDDLARSQIIKEEFYREQFGVGVPGPPPSTNDAPTASDEAQKQAEELLTKQKKEEEFIKKAREIFKPEASQQETQQQAPQGQQPRPINPDELTPGQNEFFGAFIPKQW